MVNAGHESAPPMARRRKVPRPRCGILPTARLPPAIARTELVRRTSRLGHVDILLAASFEGRGHGRHPQQPLRPTPVFVPGAVERW
jgi:hypothetical protein